MAAIDKEQVQKVSHLARLQLTPEEEEQFTVQLGDILQYFDRLNELETDNVKPTTRAINLRNVMRADELEDFSNREDILKCAPDSDGDFFKVPKILSEEG